MAEEQKPMVRVIGFETTYEKYAKHDEHGDRIVDDKGDLVLELQEEDWVTYAPAHNPIGTQTRERVRHIRPEEGFVDSKNGEKGRFLAARWAQIEPAYEAWKKGHEIPLNGTPLAQWPGCSKAQAEALQRASIRTVEEVRDMTDPQCDRVRMPNVRELRKSAQIFLDNRDAAASAEREAERDNKINELEEKLAAAMELLAEKDDEPEDDEAASLRAELDKRGISYHHRTGVKRLRELLLEEAA